MPSALASWDEIASEIGDRPVAVFLDFDGTLSPIVDDPADAAPLPGIPEAVARLAGSATVAVVSGRGAGDVRSRLGVDGLHVAGSHGFEILFPDGRRHVHPDAASAQPALDAAAERLHADLAGVAGAIVEPKPFGLSVHDRMVADPDRPQVEAAVAAVAAAHPRLRLTHGKRVAELRPSVEWHKGRAVRWLVDDLGLGDAAPVYVGDDRTDEDAFVALGPTAISIVVTDPADAPRPTVARFAVTDPGEVRTLLGRLADHLERRPEPDPT